MLKKLMKYDLRAIGRLWWLIAIFTVAVCTFEGFLLRGSLSLLGQNGGTVWAVLGMIAFYLGMVSVSMTLPLTLLLVFYRFYRQLYTDVGYLTFTLPVSRKQVLVSKTLNAMIWSVLQLCTLGVGVGIILLCAPPASDGGAYFNPIIYTELIGMIREVWSSIGVYLIVYAVEIVALLLIGVWIAVGFAQLCITVGATVFKKFKLVAATVIYLVTSAFVLFVIDMLTSVSVVLLADGFVDVLATSVGAVQSIAFAIILLIACLIMAAVATFIHLVTLDRIERKLRLA